MGRIDEWMDTLLFSQDKAKMMFEKTTEYFINWGNALIEDGADFLVMPVIFCNPGFVTLNIVKDIILNVFENAFKEIKGPLIFHQTGKPIANFLQYYNGLPNVTAFVIDTEDTFKVARKIIGTERLLLGNIDGPNLVNLKPNQVRMICEKILKDRKDDKHFILASSRADVAYDTPLENITTVFETVNSFKRSE